MPGAGTLGISVPFADARYLRLSGANQASWAPTSTVVPNLNASLLEGHNAAYFSLSGHTHAHSTITGLDYASAGHTGFEPTVTKGNLTESTSSVLTIGSGTGSVIGSGTTLQVKQASGAQSGYLSSGDWTTFNSKQSALSFPLAANLGGTGVANNAASTLTISGAFATTLTITNVTALTLPTSGYLAYSAGTSYCVIDNYIDQAVKVASTPKFASLTLGASGITNPLPATVVPFYTGVDGASCYVGGASASNTQTDGGVIFLSRARGTHAVPLAVQSADYLGSIVFSGQFHTHVGDAIGSAYIIARTTENWESAKYGSELHFIVTATGSASNVTALKMLNSGALETDYNIRASSFTAGLNGAGGFAGSIVMCNGANPGATFTLDYTELGYVNGLNQALATTGTPQFARLALGTTVHATDILTLLSADTTASGNVLNISHSGTVTGSHVGINYVGSAVASVEQIGQSISLTGASGTNTCLKLSASGATNNYGLIVSAGMVGIKTTTPAVLFQMVGSAAVSTDRVRLSSGSCEFILNNATSHSSGPLIDYDINSSSSILDFIRLGFGTIGSGTSISRQRIITSTPAFSTASGTTPFTNLHLGPMFIQSGSASGACKVLDINPTYTGVLGLQYLIDMQIGSTSWYKFMAGNTATTGGFNAASGVETGVTINPIVNQSGTAGFNVMSLSQTWTSGGSGVYNVLNITQNSNISSSVGVNILHSGVVVGTGYALYASKTGASTLNVGGYFSASGGTANYAIQTDGTVYIASSLNQTGITFGSLGTASTGIDFSGSGLTGGDSLIYAASNIYWQANGAFTTASDITCSGRVYCNYFASQSAVVLTVYGKVVDGAGAYAYKVGNLNALTVGAKTVAGSDRYITGFYNDALTTLQAWIASNGVYGQRDGATYFGMLSFASTTALGANHMLTVDLKNLDQTLGFGINNALVHKTLTPTKSGGSSTAGTLWELVVDDGNLYVCTTGGAAGTAVWKSVTIA